MRKILESLWGAVQIAVQVALGPVLHRWRTRWGASPNEIALPLPGDELVPAPSWSYNRAITIYAPPTAVWPWLVQLGQGRGGFYSYEGLENLVGCDIHNVMELRPDLQRLGVGDRVRMYRNGFGPEVALLDPPHALVLGGTPDASGSRFTWAFYVLDAGNGRSRLVERGRSLVGRGLLARLGAGPYFMDPVGFVMSWKMLRTIKQLAERAAAADAARAPAVA